MPLISLISSASTVLIPLSPPLVHAYTHRSPGRQLGEEGTTDTTGAVSLVVGADEADGRPSAAQPVRASSISTARKEAKAKS